MDKNERTCVVQDHVLHDFTFKDFGGCSCDRPWRLEGVPRLRELRALVSKLNIVIELSGDEASASASTVPFAAVFLDDILQYCYACFTVVGTCPFA